MPSPQPPKPLKAYCSSVRCTSNVYMSKYVEKVVAKAAISCPDCGHILLWKKEGSNRAAPRQNKQYRSDYKREFL